MVADLLDLAQQVRADDDRHAELGAGPTDQVEHLVAPCRVQAIRGLVEQEELRVVHQGLGELDPLLASPWSSRRWPVALLEEPNVAQDLCRPLASRGPRQAGHLGEMRHEVRRGDVGRQDVVLGHVPDLLTDPRAVASDVEVQHGGRAGGRGEEPEEDPEERALAGAVGTHEPDDPRLDRDGEIVEGKDSAAGTRVSEGERLGRDEGHRGRV